MVKKITKTKIIGLYLNNYGKRIYLRELASLLEKPHQTIKPYVEELIKEKILIKEQRKNIIDYSLNFKNKKVYDYLAIAEKEKLIETLDKGAILNVLYEKLSEKFTNTSFIIFGSAVGTLKKDSDIDLLIIGKQSSSKEIKDFEEVYNKKIHWVQISSLNKLSSALTKEIYKKHLILNNTERIVRFFGGLYEQNRLV